MVLFKYWHIHHECNNKINLKNNIGEIEKEKVYITVEIIEYVPNAVVVITILKNHPEI